MTCGPKLGAPTLIQIGNPGRTDRGVETNDEVDTLIAAGSPVAIGVSGGKDSCAAALATIEYLDAVGHTGPRVLIHADLGDPDPSLDVEWSDSLPTCQRLADRLGIELIIARRPAGGMMKRWLKRWENNLARYRDLSCVKIILPWSTPSMRFCTSELKSAPMASALVKRFPGQTIISACGVRREESPDRSEAVTSKPNTRLTNKKHGTSGVDWNPIAAWSERDVFAFCADRGFEMHEGYTRYGMSRISCRYCIMQKRSDMVASARVPANQPVLRTIVDLEIRSTFGFQGSTWLADIAPHVLDEATRAEVATAKASAAQRAAAEKRVPKHLLYTKGWPTVMPTHGEAELIAEVRREVAALLRIEVKCTTADAVVARYAELMAKNAAREKAQKNQRSRWQAAAAKRASKLRKRGRPTGGAS